MKDAKTESFEGQFDMKTLGFWALLPVFLSCFAWFLGTFQTSREAETQFNMIEKRLERLELKIDSLVERGGNRNQKSDP